jgi:hypothetical protein
MFIDGTFVSQNDRLTLLARHNILIESYAEPLITFTSPPPPFYLLTGLFTDLLLPIHALSILSPTLTFPRHTLSSELLALPLQAACAIFTIVNFQIESAARITPSSFYYAGSLPFFLFCEKEKKTVLRASPLLYLILFLSFLQFRLL